MVIGDISASGRLIHIMCLFL